MGPCGKLFLVDVIWVNIMDLHMRLSVSLGVLVLTVTYNGFSEALQHVNYGLI